MLFSSFCRGESTYTLVVNGTGKSEKEAVDDALRLAILQANGEFQSSKTRSHNDNIDSDVISSSLKGKIKEYNKLGVALSDDGGYNVSVKVVVISEAGGESLSSSKSTANIGGSDFIKRKRICDLQIKSELELIKSTINNMYDLCNKLYDYEVKKMTEPKYDGKEYYTVKYEVKGKPNKNKNAYDDALNASLKVLAMSKDEQRDFEDFYHQKPFYWKAKKIYLRNEESVELLDFYIPLLETHSIRSYYIFDNIGGEIYADEREESEGKYPHRYLLRWTESEMSRVKDVSTKNNLHAEVQLPSDHPDWVPNKLQAQLDRKKRAAEMAQDNSPKTVRPQLPNDTELVENAQNGDAESQAIMSRCYRKGEMGVDENPKEAISWALKSAEQGCARGIYELGLCYFSGIGVEKSEIEAVKLFQKSANLGYSDAQNNLGCCYEAGRGVKQSFKDAALWYQKAAKSGNMLGQYNLGICYAKGKGVVKNEKTAIFWLKKSAAQGYKPAISYFVNN